MQEASAGQQMDVDNGGGAPPAEEEVPVKRSSRARRGKASTDFERPTAMDTDAKTPRCGWPMFRALQTILPSCGLVYDVCSDGRIQACACVPVVHMGLAMRRGALTLTKKKRMKLQLRKRKGAEGSGSISSFHGKAKSRRKKKG